jgi:hypothetical protein
LILINVRNNNINVSLPPALTGTFYNLLNLQDEALGASLALSPYAYRIYQMN